jgi:DNA invertase Pin-like site-specific DNA recombinase
MTATIGYARDSSSGQSTDTQVDRLKAAGCTVIRKESVSGRSRDGRSELNTILEFIQPGDTLTVVKLDRLGRSTRAVLNLVHELEGRGAHLRGLEPEISTAGPMGKMVLTVLGMVAEMELGFIRERQRVGIEAAKANGVYKGRPVTLDHPRTLAMLAEGKGPRRSQRHWGAAGVPCTRPWAATASVAAADFRKCRFSEVAPNAQAPGRPLCNSSLSQTAARAPFRGSAQPQARRALRPSNMLCVSVASTGGPKA